MLKSFLTLLFALTVSVCLAQKITINGTIKDSENGETLIGVNVYDPGNQKGTSSNNYGFYSYTTAKGQVELVFSYVGYEPFVFKTMVQKDTTLNVRLRPAHLAEVVIEGSREEVIQERTQMGAVNVPIRQIQSAPALFGEVDVLKVLQLLPGVQSGSEGTSGLYVRGGGPDQNLILLDGVPVYNASHLFGFFSVFNADAIKNVELVKGGFPARYGGRLSSVIDISMKEGNMTEFGGEGTIGLIASKLTLEGPIVKDKTSFILSGRRSYLNLLQMPFINNPLGEGDNTGYYFYDVNAKVNHIINDNNRLYLSFYGGNDSGYTNSSNFYSHENQTISVDEETSMGWGNVISALRWNHVFNKKLFANFSGTYTKYHFNLLNSIERITKDEGELRDEYYYHADYRSGIRDYALKADFDYIPSSSHYLRFGASHIFHRFTPGVYATQLKDEVIDRPSLSISDSQEFAVYVEDDIDVSKKLKVNLGLHYSGFMVGEKNYESLQPRFSARYLLDGNSSIKASYANMAQFVHLLTNAGMGLPTDLWVPATENIGPQESWQTSLGYYKTIPGGFEFSVEGYYKDMEGLLEYKDGVTYLDIDGNWEDKVEVGRGRSYGMEFFLQKKTGKTTGWIGYTLSRSERQFEQFNDNEWFPFRYDRTHDISLTVSHHYTDRIHFSGTWVYGTGNAITIPTHIYQTPPPNPNGVPGYLHHHAARNNYRMNAYHRLDLGVSFIKPTRWGQRVWNVSVYNAYNRLNPFYVDIRRNYAEHRNMFVQHTLFPALPSVSYGFKF